MSERREHRLRRHPAVWTRLVPGLMIALGISSATARAATLKAVQSGTTTIAASSASITVTLTTAVNPSQSFLVFGVAEAEDEPQTGQVVGRLSSATTVDFLRNTAVGSAISIKWYVAEFSSGVSVQRGITVVPNDTPLNQAITSVNTTQAFPIVTTLSGGTGFDRNDFIRAKITGATTLQLNHGDTGSSATAYWQVVEYQGATVQTGDVTFNPTDLSLTATPASSVNPARSWLLFSDECHASPVQASCGSNTNIGPRLFRGVVTNGTTLTFDRSVAGATGPPPEVYQLTWYLIEFNDGTTVQSGSEPFGAAETQRDVPLAALAPTGSSLAAASAFMRGGRSPYTLDDVPGVGWFTLDLTSASNLRLTRGSTNAPGSAPAAGADVGWFVVTFTCCAPLTAAEGAGTVTVTAPGSFEMTFNTSTGGGIEKFYDLAEDPGRVNDLAGGATAGKALFGDGLGIGANTYNINQNNAGVKLDVLEATPTRMRVRQEAFYQQEPGTALRAGIKGFGDYSIYPAGRLAFRWNQRTTSAVTYVFDDLDLVVHLQGAGTLSNWTPYREAGASFPGTGNDDFLLAQIEVAGARTDFLDIMYKDWTIGNGYPGTADTTDWFSDAGNERGNPFWGHETGGATIPAPTGPYSTQVWPGVWNFLTYFKPTNFANRTDTAVTSRSSDYRSPSGLSVLVGSPWQLGSENTGGGDDYNESEGAYVLTMDPTNGLKFRIDGSAAVPRYKPFFKIRQWRSFAGPILVTLQGTPLAAGSDYRADVKPVSRAAFMKKLLWHSTLESAASVTTSPDIGSTGQVKGALTFVSARYGAGASVTANSTYLVISVTDGAGTALPDFDKAKGAIEFWYQPTYASTDNNTRDLAGLVSSVANNQILFQKLNNASGNDLLFRIQAGGTNSDCQVSGAAYSWNANDWVHVRLEWDETAVPASQQKVYLDGALKPCTATPTDYVAANLNLGVNGELWVGNINNGAFQPGVGIYDELQVYGGSSAPATALADGGLIGSSSEYLADGAKNLTFGFSGVDGVRRGEYLYLGADSQFRGLNVGLSTAGAGVAAGDLDWEYWNGTAWANLELVGGFTDQTNSFTKTGSLFWGDPPTWSPYSVNGGPDLYYVRTHLKNGSTYSTSPIEGVIKTDILLFQYCGDIVAAGQEFVFNPPAPTAVELVSFEARGLDRSIELQWKTASELHNLGFHLYRATAERGPYTRLTDGPIAGLGSSPSGADYRYVDSPLSNQTTYFYQLEDIDTSGKTQRHGPVSATPTASAPPVSTPPPPSAKVSSGAETQSNGLRVLEQSSRRLVLELSTPAFAAETQPDGSVRLSIPGFFDHSEPGSPAIPVLQTWLGVPSGAHVRLGSVRADDLARFSSVRPEAASAPELIATRQGNVVPSRRRRREGAAFRNSGLVPDAAAKLLEVGFQGESEKAHLELAPLRWDPSSGELLLARRLVVELLFSPETRRPRVDADAHSRGVARRLLTRERGLYRVRFEDLFGTAARPVRSESLRLSRLGQTVAFHLEPDGALFARGSSLYFLGEGASANPYGDVAVYELDLGSGGETMPVLSPAPTNSQPVSFYRQTVSREENVYYQAALVDAPDVWLWDLLFAPVSKSYSFTISALALASTVEPAHLSVWLQGVSDLDGSPDHHLRLSVNGTFLAESSLDGKSALTMTAEIPPGLLHDGDNSLEIENVGDTGVSYSMVMLDRFEVTYPRSVVLNDDALEGTFSSPGSVHLDPGAAVLVLDTTGTAPRWLGSASFEVEPGHRYLVVSRPAVLRPEVATVPPSRLADTRNQADYLVIGPQAFLDTVEPLLALRRSQGLSSRAVSIEDVYSAFGFGESRPQALRDFLAFAFHSWKKPAPRYAVLLGDATYDFKDYLHTGVRNQVPPFIIKTSFLWTASDSAFAAVNGDDILPDLAIGRLPAADHDQARDMVQKILDFESSGSLFSGPTVLVADNPDDAGNFEAHADEIAATLLSGRDTRKIYLSRLGPDVARNQIRQAFDDGAVLWSYLGHGGIQLWAQEDIFDTTQLSSLSPQSRQPLLLTWNCLNGYFLFPYFDSLAEALVKAPDKGAIATFSPSGLSLDEPAHLYHRLFLQEILSRRHRRLGDALLEAQSRYADSSAFPELLQIYLLLGDPALTLR
jgi:Peptidase family C25